MEFEYEKQKPHCPVVDVDGFIANGKQFDLDITLPNDNRDVIFGVIRNCFKEPVDNAVVKLIEVERKMGKEERKPVSHTFTDKEGEFVFGPLCPGKEYVIQIWVDDVKHVKVCAKTFREGKCLKGVKLHKCDKDCDKPHYDDYENKDYDREPHCDDCKDKDYDKNPHCDDCKDKDYDKNPHYDDCKDKDYDKKPHCDDCKDKDYDKKSHCDDCKDKDYDKKPNYENCEEKDYDKKPDYNDDCNCKEHNYDEYPHKDCDKKDDKKADEKDDKKDDRKDFKYNKYYNYR